MPLCTVYSAQLFFHTYYKQKNVFKDVLFKKTLFKLVVLYRQNLLNY